MTTQEIPGVVNATREIAAEVRQVFELIADPAPQPRWDGNDNLAEASEGQRVHSVGENHVVEFDEGRRIAWRPAEPGQEPPGHLWAWTLDPIDSSRSAPPRSWRTSPNSPGATAST